MGLLGGAAGFGGAEKIARDAFCGLTVDSSVLAGAACWRGFGLAPICGFPGTDGFAATPGGFAAGAGFMLPPSVTEDAPVLSPLLSTERGADGAAAGFATSGFFNVGLGDLGGFPGF